MKALKHHKIIVSVLTVEILLMISVIPVSSPDEPTYIGIVIIPFTLAIWGICQLIKRLGKYTRM